MLMMEEGVGVEWRARNKVNPLPTISDTGTGTQKDRRPSSPTSQPVHLSRMHPPLTMIPDSGSSIIGRVKHSLGRIAQGMVPVGREATDEVVICRSFLFYID